MLGAAVCLTQGEAMAYLGAVCWVSFSEDAFPLSIIYTYTSQFPAFCRAVHMVGVLFLLISFCCCCWFFSTSYFVFEYSLLTGFPGGSAVKKQPARQDDPGDAGWIPRSGRSLGGGHGNPLQYSCLKNPMVWGDWWTTVLKSRSTTSRRSRARLKRCSSQAHIALSQWLDGFRWKAKGLSHTYSPNIPPTQTDKKHWVEFHVLYNRSLLVIHFEYKSVHDLPKLPNYSSPPPTINCFSKSVSCSLFCKFICIISF